MKKKIINYLIYFICLPLIGFASLFLFKNGTRGAHDGGTLAMVFGLFVGQVFFTIWLTNLKWFFGFIVGLFVGFISLVITFWTFSLLADYLITDQLSVTYFKPNPQIDLLLEIFFFAVLLLSSVLIFELINKLVKK